MRYDTSVAIMRYDTSVCSLLPARAVPGRTVDWHVPLVLQTSEAGEQASLREAHASGRSLQLLHARSQPPLRTRLCCTTYMEQTDIHMLKGLHPVHPPQLLQPAAPPLTLSDVEQTDIHMPRTTVREALQISGVLRLHNASSEKVELFVDEVGGSATCQEGFNCMLWQRYALSMYTALLAAPLLALTHF